MATSFADQIPIILWVVTSLKPTRILDVGKGFGKYGFLIHEYYGIDSSLRPNPKLTLKNQSSVTIDCVDINTDYAFTHLPDLYSRIIDRDIATNFKDLTGYDLILMADVIEHLQKDDGDRLLRFFLASGANILVSTPLSFFQQELYGSDSEHHVSYWSRKDFRNLGCYLSYQNTSSGGVYLLSSAPIRIPGFGNSLSQKIRRIVRLLLNELGI